MTEMTNPILSERAQRRIKRVAKHVVHPFRMARGRATPVFVLGYGRSGTTMLIDALEHDMRIEVYQENDPRIARQFLLEWERLAPAITACQAPVAVMKPILDSFAVKRLLSVHPKARVLWMLRDVDAVVRSALKKFGPGVAESLQRNVNGQPDDSWLARGAPAEALQQLRSLEQGQLATEDWMALVWWIVNRTLIVENLSAESRLTLVRYERLLQSPEETMQQVYDVLGLPVRPASIRWLEAGSPSRKLVSLHASVRAMCEALEADIARQFST